MRIDLGEDPLALDRQVCFALSVASRSVIAIYRPLLKPYGLTHPQYLVLLALWDSAPRTVRDLSDVLRAEPATLSPLLKRLETLGYVSRGRGRGDERTLTVDLTEKGKALRAEAEKIPYRVVETLGMEVSELERLHAVLGKVIAATDRAGARS
ncbi:MarR family transcriptional regulator [Prauserella marina]|uniref:DNA-binding transcriptional regulator, MarR family n=1 Tax=Prauserella marina TaxID=530584 RepID=A0A222VQR2_9PSEU|nr:MarR family transcriptional regulator [Prauserella marina]ASR36073.1 MarR family transcriptional regulator [Prauserella marina]PWV76801.1 DNA-binding MarR family transcriptional regulator [Prauserella marina]SDC97915.1 DNA-binding transcriptional regulator, MarR family [Prauserella marina]